ncbi:pyridoxamine 5'-phosphate oxidase family protein [Massilia sp. CF038]|uniref:pyridoxamine 5'-phosphate oxidase family protein n=1 Tax=Massilia sp. CF038 TaxID=1881045 RepID=UPI0009235A89|nr:pyridoxamine 5'-phosphate oxidase family protein [Massilia sp. CF038]SHH71240.1 hypothetical protein SAMN05428948_5050 [Massilia sp. CF038]
MSSFHPGELRAQHLAGVVGNGAGIRAFMPEQHRLFFEAQACMFVATIDANGQPRAQVLHGSPGFVHTPDDVSLTIATEARFTPGSPIGLLGLDFSNRRRNRANGVVRSSVPGQLVLDLRESFGNCPRYISLRDLHLAAPAPGPVTHFAGLDPAAAALVAQADTFFIATSGGVHGVDISHRGGAPGFVRIDGTSLQVPDYAGNRFFNTLGNLVLDARAALLFLDFARGDVLELQGSVSISWQQDGAAQVRSWRFDCRAGTLARAALPLRWTDR